METTLTNVKENLFSITMTIPAAEATSAYNTAASRISQYLNVDGFRKGKAPRAVVERHVGVDRIQQEALEILLPKYLGQAIYDNKLDVITQPAITNYKFETGKDVEVTFEVETRPEVSLGSYKGLNVKVEVPAQDDNAMDKAIEGFLTQHSSMDLVIDQKKFFAFKINDVAKTQANTDIMEAHLTNAKNAFVSKKAPIIAII